MGYDSRGCYAERINYEEERERERRGKSIGTSERIINAGEWQQDVKELQVLQIASQQGIKCKETEH